MPNIELIGAKTCNTMKPYGGVKSFKKGEVYPVSDAEWAELASHTNPGSGAAMFAVTDREVGSVALDLVGINRGDLKASDVRTLSNEVDTAQTSKSKKVPEITPEELAELEEVSGDAPEGDPEAAPEDAPSDAPEEAPAPAAPPAPKATLNIGGKKSPASKTPPAPAPGKAEEV